MPTNSSTSSHDGLGTLALTTGPAGAFCPAGGLLRGVTDQFEEDARQYLRNRLRMTAWVLFGGFLGFLVLILVMDPRPQHDQTGLWPHVAVTAMLAIVGVSLSGRWSPSSLALRGMEALIFGVPAAFFLWSKISEALLMPPPLMLLADGAVQPLDLGFLPSTAIPWILLSQLYGVFIPNSWRRATAMVSLLSLAPLGVCVAVASRREDIYFLLMQGGLPALLLWMTISGVIAVYGSHRFGRLRREAFDARQLGSYTLREKLGAGGMGEVYLAEHRLLKRPAAIKLIRPEKAGDQSAVLRFEGEVQATAALTHPNTVEIYDYGHTDDGTFYYVMEYLPGLNLHELVDRYGPLPPERVVHLIRQTCAALREAHAAGLIHRDVKPGNIFTCERGGVFDVAKLLDFGLVKSLRTEGDAHLTQVGSMVGSPHFAAPEAMLENAADARSDVYSLGATMYFLLTARTMFPGTNVLKIMMAHQGEPVKPPSQHNSEIPADLEAVILKCVQKKPEERFPSVDAMSCALAKCACASGWTEEVCAEWWRSTGEASRSMQDTAVGTTALTDQMTLVRADATLAR